MDEPSDTTILGAAKVTGKSGPWSIGVLDALTASEQARIDIAGTTFRQQVEPLTNYFVARETRDIGTSSRVGFMITSVDRKLPNELTDLRQRAETAGVDGYTAFPSKDWIFEWFGAASRVSGSAESIANTQESSSRYMQRPDATSFHFDPTRTSLDGWAGKAMISKQTGLWRPIVEVQAYSQGFETNDVGFMQRTDIISSHVVMQYVNQDTTTHFRERDVWVGVWSNRNFDGNTLDHGLYINHFATLASYWSYGVKFNYTPGALDDRATRGGPLLQVPRSWSTDVNFGSDQRRKFYFTINGHDDGSGDGSYSRTAGITLNAQPSSRLQLSISPALTRSHNHTQYVTTVSDPAATSTFGARYIFSDLEQHSLALDTRVDWTLTSKVSFQLYMQPFVASGHYHDDRALAFARTADFIPYAGVANPDFNFRSVRASAVARWEFRPGSALYVVWNENRADTLPIGDFRVRRDLGGIVTAPSHDVVLVKVSYWLPR